jgi:hypothetical protein
MVIREELVGDGVGGLVVELAGAEAAVDTGSGAWAAVVRTGVGVARACDREAVVAFGRAGAVVGAVVVAPAGAWVVGAVVVATAGVGDAAEAGSARPGSMNANTPTDVSPATQSSTREGSGRHAPPRAVTRCLASSRT